MSRVSMRPVGMRTAVAVAGLVAACLLPPLGGAAAAQEKVLRYALRVAETGFDPTQTQDLYSSNMNAHMFDAPLAYDYLARPATLKPNTAAAMPEVSADGREYTLRIRPGIHFADDEAFNGQKRELTAGDYVYSLKRQFDPRWKSPNLYLVEDYMPGLKALRAAALAGKPFDYDKPVEDVRALDRYTYRIRLAKPNYNFLHYLAFCNLSCATAREVVEHYDAKVSEHPVGTGPFRLVFWKRSSKMVFERNPNFREELYDAEPPADDPASQAIAARLKGRRLPMVDRVEVSVVEEAQPRWLAFLNGEHDFLEELPPDFANIAIPNNVLAPHLRKRGVQMDRVAYMSLNFAFYNMENPIVGGYTPEKVALRRAINLSYDVDEEIQVVRKGQAIPAHQPVGPGAQGYDPGYRSSEAGYDPARAKALLDLYGYVDRDGDGYREQPDGSPLVIEYATQPDSQGVQFEELWKKGLDAIGLRMVSRRAKWPENLKAARQAKLMFWAVGWSAAIPDAEAFYGLFYGPYSGQSNFGRFKLARYDALFAKSKVLPPGPERDAVYHELNRLVTAYAPARLTTHRMWTDMMQPWMIGYRKHPVMRQWWQYVDIDPNRRGTP